MKLRSSNNWLTENTFFKEQGMTTSSLISFKIISLMSPLQSVRKGTWTNHNIIVVSGSTGYSDHWKLNAQAPHAHCSLSSTCPKVWFVMQILWSSYNCSLATKELVHLRLIFVDKWRWVPPAPGFWVTRVLSSSSKSHELFLVHWQEPLVGWVKTYKHKRG